MRSAFLIKEESYMAFDVRNFVIDRPTRFVMLHSATSEILWTIDQITNPTLSMTADTVDATDAIGSKIMTFERAKNAEFTAESSMFNLGLAAAQFGTTKKIATSDAKVTVPKFETLTIPSTGTTVTLSKTPKGSAAAGIAYVYKLNTDSSIATKYAYGATATANTFTFTDKSLTFPTGLVAGDRIFVVYEYEADDTNGNSAAAVVADAKNFPVAGRGILEILGKDVCSPSVLVYAYIVFDNCKLMSNVDIAFQTDMAHGLTIQANQSYCDPDRKLFSIIIPES
jgi:hypothetical protein